MSNVNKSSTDQELILLDNVSKCYETEAEDFLALKDINLSIGKGEFVGVIGKSGSGKSTLINMMTGIDRPTEGEVFIGGTGIHTYDENKMAIWRGNNVGIVFQFFQLLPTLTVLENIMLPMDFCNVYESNQRPTKAMDLLKLVNLEKHAHKLPSQLSGGQQQRIAIARALANDPPIIMADEPTGNLDSRTAEHIFEIFERLVNDGKTIVMVTHDSDQAKRVSRSVIIADGEVIEEYLEQTFPKLNQEQLIWVTKKAKEQAFDPGETILERGKRFDNFYIVTKGIVEICIRTKTGRDYVVARFGRGDYFGEIELLKGGTSLATAQAYGDGPVEVTTIGKKDFQKLMEMSADTKDQITKIAAARLKEHKTEKGK